MFLSLNERLRCDHFGGGDRRENSASAASARPLLSFIRLFQVLLQILNHFVSPAKATSYQ